jgi:hypothetical protein
VHGGALGLERAPAEVSFRGGPWAAAVAIGKPEMGQTDDKKLRGGGFHLRGCRR